SDKPQQRRVGRAFARRRPHARFQHHAAVSEFLDVFDRVPPALGRQAYADKEPVGRNGPKRARRWLHYAIILARFGMRTLWMKIMIRTRITGDTSMPPRFGRMARIGRRTGSVIR